MPLLVGLDGVDKMSKSKNNYIGIAEDANTMFAKVLSISDDPDVGLVHPAVVQEPGRDRRPRPRWRRRNPKDAKVMLAGRSRRASIKAAADAAEDFHQPARAAPDGSP